MPAEGRADQERGWGEDRTAGLRGDNVRNAVTHGTCFPGEGGRAPEASRLHLQARARVAGSRVPTAAAQTTLSARTTRDTQDRRETIPVGTEGARGQAGRETQPGMTPAGGGPPEALPLDLGSPAWLGHDFRVLRGGAACPPACP